MLSRYSTILLTLYATTDIPQSSILCLLLLVIDMNDTHNASTKFHAILFAAETLKIEWTNYRNNRTSYRIFFLVLTIDQLFIWNGQMHKYQTRYQDYVILHHNILRILCKSIILSHLQYYLLPCGFNRTGSLKHNKHLFWISTCTCSKQNAHIEQLSKILNLLEIKDIMKTKRLILW